MILRTLVLALSLFSLGTALTSSLYDLRLIPSNAAPTKIVVQNGSRVYLTSIDKAVYLSRITLNTNGVQTTLDALLRTFDAEGFQAGLPVFSDLTISNTNSENITKALCGALFFATPSMAADPNFSVYVVSGDNFVSKSQTTDATIVLLPLYVPNNADPPYEGLTHTRITNIIQSKSTSLTFYEGLPHDEYIDVDDPSTVSRRIFSNPLRIPGGEMYFFDNIDPIQYAGYIWYLRAVGGGVQFDVSSSYVDTTSIQTSNPTVTGMSNSQLFTYNSNVSFTPIDQNHLASCGYVLFADLFPNVNLTLALLGRNGVLSQETIVDERVNNHGTTVDSPALSLQIYPSALLTGSYYIQYFAVDRGVPTTTTIRTSTPSTSNPPTNPPSTSSTVVPSTASSSTVTVPTASSSTQTVQTSTKSGTTLSFILPIISMFLYLILSL